MFVSGRNDTSIGFVDDGFSIGGAPRAPRVRAFAFSTGVPPAFSRFRVSMSALTFRSSCMFRYEVDKRDRDERYYRKWIGGSGIIADVLLREVAPGRARSGSPWR